VTCAGQCVIDWWDGLDLIVQVLTSNLAGKIMNVTVALWYYLALSSVSYAIAVAAPVIISMPWPMIPFTFAGEY